MLVAVELNLAVMRCGQPARGVPHAYMEESVVVHPEAVKPGNRRCGRRSADANGAEDVARRVGHRKPAIPHAEDVPTPYVSLNGCA
jgi:hypothetical protein